MHAARVAMSWSTPADLKAQVQRLWDRGLLLRSLVGGEALFPRRLVLKSPASTDLAERFDDVRGWIASLQAAPFRLVTREVRHRVIGRNEVPQEAWVDSLDDALRLIGKSREAQRFAALSALTVERHAPLMALLAHKPLQVLALADAWPRLLEIVTWMAQHPRPGIYLRQIDLPGVHTKLIEAHLPVLAEMLDLVLPAAAIDPARSGAAGFCARYGFREKPLRVRLRMLDPALNLLPGDNDQDVTLDRHSFAALAMPPRRVFMTENETSFLAFPRVPGAIVIFGAGYGFEPLAGARWLHDCALYYWGDIDTHGFAILDQLRSRLPQVRSFLMDRGTLLAHRALWGSESSPETRDLPRLTPDERALFDDLRDNRLGMNVRLEQERIGFGCVREALQRG